MSSRGVAESRHWRYLPAPVSRTPLRRQVVGTAALLLPIAAAALLLSPETVFDHAAGIADRPALLGVALVGLYLVRPLVAWPITVVSILVGYALGVVGFPIALLGAVATCFPPYLVARYWRPDAGPLGTVADSLERTIDSTGGVRGVVAARLLPAPADGISYGAGFARVPVGAFAVGTLLGEIPWTVAAVGFGASMRHFTLDAAIDPRLVLAMAVFGTALVASPAYRLVRDDVLA